jgi:histidinol phosphatase-like enzyme
VCAFLCFVFCACCAQVSQYRLWCETVVPTLQRYHAEGYALLVVSNQNAIKSVR